MEGGGGGCDGPSLDLDPPEHFVFDLHDVPGIEEVVRAKDRIGDLRGSTIQRAVGPPPLGFGIGRRTGSPSGHLLRK